MSEQQYRRDIVQHAENIRQVLDTYPADVAAFMREAFRLDLYPLDFTKTFAEKLNRFRTHAEEARLRAIQERLRDFLVSGGLWNADSMGSQRITDLVRDSIDALTTASARLAQVEQERDTLRARVVAAEHHRAMELMSRGSAAEQLEMDLRTKLAEAQVALAAAEARAFYLEWERDRETDSRIEGQQRAADAEDARDGWTAKASQAEARALHLERERDELRDGISSALRFASPQPTAALICEASSLRVLLSDVCAWLETHKSNARTRDEALRERIAILKGVR